MIFHIKNTRLTVSPLFFILLSFLLITDTSSVMLLTVVFSAFHESAHIISMLLIKAEIGEIAIMPYGFCIRSVSSVTKLQELIMTAAGPIINLIFASAALILFFIYNTDLLLNCFSVNSVIFLLNILPIKSLDGGDIVRILTDLLFNKKISTVICKILGYITAISLCAGGVALFIFFGNFALFALGLFLLITNIFNL